MSNDENLQSEKENAKEKKLDDQFSDVKQTLPTDQQAEDRFPKWDILPPYQFINPRLKKKE